MNGKKLVASFYQTHYWAFKKEKQKNKVGKAQQALSLIEKIYKADHLAAK
jgi:hypothetical protein